MILQSLVPAWCDMCGAGASDCDIFKGIIFSKDFCIKGAEIL